MPFAARRTRERFFWWRFCLGTGLSGYEGIEPGNTVSELMSSIACAFTERMDMRTKSNSRTITEKRSERGKLSQFAVVRRLPSKRPPTHPWERDPQAHRKRRLADPERLEKLFEQHLPG